MPYFQLRITLSETRTKKTILRSIKYLIREYNMTLYSTGYEEYNKYGEPCDPHFHFNFVEDLDRVNPKRCIADKLKRYYEQIDVSLKGNKQWSLQMVEEPNDFDRWFRYPLKENPILDMVRDGTSDLSGNMGPDPDELDKIVSLAKSERRTSIEINILRREKQRNKDKFKDNLYTFIKSHDQDELNPLLTGGYTIDHKRVWKLIYKYYRSQERPINWTTIEGYTNLFLADAGVIDDNDAFNLAHGLY